MFMRLTPANSHRKYDPGVNFHRVAKTQNDTLPAMMLAIIPAAATMRLEPVELSATVEIEITFTPGTRRDRRPCPSASWTMSPRA